MKGTHAAGYVISGFSNLVMSGDFVIGLIVFMILIIVNFIVITKGATRIAEVGARFTLDAIPGKQMSIDADLSAGVIDDKTAQLRRRELEEESSFFGSMDGASKFVRGDAIAGLIITFINIVGGIIIGYFRHGMDLAHASDVFIKLSVGDGLVTQIPALIVSLAAGLLVSKGGTRGSADKAVFGQLGAYPRALYVAALLLIVLALMPGLPMFPFVMLAAAMGALAYIVPLQASRRTAAAEAVKKQDAANKVDEEKNSVKASLATAEIELLIGKQLSTKLIVAHQELAFRMSKMRKKFATQYGFVVPEVKLTDDFGIPSKSYQIKVHGTVVAEHAMRVGEIMVLLGTASGAGNPRRGGARAGLRHARLVGAGDVLGGSEARAVHFRRQHVGAAYPPLRGHPQQPAAASFLQGHEGAARPSGPGIPQARRRDLHLAYHLSRPAGGAEASARRARLDPQSALDHRGDRRDRAACAPHRADRRACAHPHGTADLRRSFRGRRAQGSRLGNRWDLAFHQASSATPRARCASSTSIRASSRSSARTPRRRSVPTSMPANVSCWSQHPTRGPMCA